MLPTRDEHRWLWELAAQGKSLEAEDTALFDQAQRWRAVRLPDMPDTAANFIWWCLEQKVFAQMLHCTLAPQPDDLNTHEIAPDGVGQFWETVSHLLVP